MDALIKKESNYRVDATNKTSGAFGIPQSLPASKMASAGADWKTNPETQLRWMCQYIRDRKGYGNPTNALNFHLSHNYY